MLKTTVLTDLLSHPELLHLLVDRTATEDRLTHRTQASRLAIQARTPRLHTRIILSSKVCQTTTRHLRKRNPVPCLTASTRSTTRARRKAPQVYTPTLSTHTAC